MEMIYALDKDYAVRQIEDTLLYGVEVKFYNMEVALDEHLESGAEPLCYRKLVQGNRLPFPVPPHRHFVCKRNCRR